MQNMFKELNKLLNNNESNVIKEEINKGNIYENNEVDRSLEVIKLFFK